MTVEFGWMSCIVPSFRTRCPFLFKEAKSGKLQRDTQKVRGNSKTVSTVAWVRVKRDDFAACWCPWASSHFLSPCRRLNANRPPMLSEVGVLCWRPVSSAFSPHFPTRSPNNDVFGLCFAAATLKSPYIKIEDVSRWVPVLDAPQDEMIELLKALTLRSDSLPSLSPVKGSFHEEPNNFGHFFSVQI